MANFAVQAIRNLAVIAHGGAGKTSLIEAMLYDAGSTDRMGSIQDGTTVMDFEPEEIERKATLGTSAAFCQWKGSRLNIIDTPGLINFMEETHESLRAADGAVLLISPLSGVKAETEKVLGFANEFGIPVLAFMNKMDKESADFPKTIEGMEKAFGREIIPLQVPIGAGATFSGFVDLIEMKAYIYGNGKPRETEIPSEAAADVEKYRKKLVEKIAEADDNLLSIYLEGGEIKKEEIINGVKTGSITRSFIPVIVGSAVRNIGVDRLMDMVILTLPSPDEIVKVAPIKGKDPKTGHEAERPPDEKSPFSAYVFKTVADPFAGRLSFFRIYSGVLSSDSQVYNSSRGVKERIGQISYLMGKKHIPAQKLGPGEIGMVAKLKETFTGDTLCDEAQPIVFEKVKLMEPIISYAIASKGKGDEDKVSSGLHRILEEDATLNFHRDEETREMILSGMGQLHLEVALERLKRKFGADVEMKTPKIPYRETITGSTKVQGRYKKQSGGRGQYGDCWIEVRPLKRGSGFEFIDKIVGGAIPRNYIPAVEKGVADALHEGVLAGFPVVDVSVTLFDGSFHPVDSSEMAFKIAGSMAIKKAALEARPVLLEPIMKCTIVTPEEALGAVIGDLNAKRGKVQGMEQSGANQKITALVPMSEMLAYGNQLQSLTAGRGIYTMEFSHYEQMPPHLAQKVIAERQAERKEKEE
ncbi:MAG: elongation factor G [Nitrospiraceae bacterium]|nr:elongation factor G [Nitrospiraceae bacterium]